MFMNCKIQQSKLSGRIVCPANKSYTHRAIFLAALSDGKSIVKNKKVIIDITVNKEINLGRFNFFVIDYINYRQYLR